MHEKDNLEPSSQSCPYCGGVMQRETLGRIHEYRCHTGHRFGTKTMLVEKSSTLERALFAALAQAEELVALLEESKDDLPSSAGAELAAEIAARREETQLLREFIERRSATHLESALSA